MQAPDDVTICEPRQPTHAAWHDTPTGMAIVARCGADFRATPIRFGRESLGSMYD